MARDTEKRSPGFDKDRELRTDDPTEGQPPNPVNGPADSDLKVVGKDEIGAGTGLDEAELARVDPLDGEPWDGEEER